jgi:transposase InsO family protein
MRWPELADRLDAGFDCSHDELLNRELSYTLTEAQVLTEWWRQEYNHLRPHSALGYRPPAPEAIAPPPLCARPIALPAMPALT